MSVTKQNKSRQSLRQIFGIASLSVMSLSIAGAAMATIPAGAFPTGTYRVNYTGFDNGEFTSSGQTCFTFMQNNQANSLSLNAKPFGTATYAVTDMAADKISIQAVYDKTYTPTSLLKLDAVVSKQNNVFTSLNGKIQDLSAPAGHNRYYTISGQKVASCSVRPQHW